MKAMFCVSITCGDRRIHHENSTPRGMARVIRVPDDFKKDKMVYCSIECFNYDKAEKKTK